MGPALGRIAGGDGSGQKKSQTNVPRLVSARLAIGRRPSSDCTLLQQRLGARFIPRLPHRRYRPARPDLGERWPSRLVATAAASRLMAALAKSWRRHKKRCWA